MTRHFCVGFAVLIVFTSFAAAQPPAIAHEPVACAVAERFPKLVAQFVPAEGVAKARVVFQGAIASEWYSVDMKVEGANFSGILPKPQKSLKSFRYYLEVTDRTLGTNRTEEYTAAVVDGANACRGKLMAGALASAAVILQGPAGVAALPAGFASAGVVAGTAAGSSAGAAGAAGASSAGAGGGIGATALVVGGIAVAGGAAAVVASNSGGGDGDSGSSGGSGPGGSNASYDVVFQPPATLDLTPCGANSGITGLAGIQPAASGAFSEVHTQGTPVVRVTGQVTPTAFQASLACVNGALSGSLSATGANDNYSGAFVFGASSGSLTVRKR